MKIHYITSLIAIFAVSLFLLACNKDKNPNSTEQKTLLNSMSYAVDSIYPNGDTTHTITSMIANNFLLIDCTYGNNGNLTLALDSAIHIGTYNLDNSPWASPRIIYTDNQNTEPFYSTSGTITILMHSSSQRMIKGTFNGVVRQPNYEVERVISNGSFWIEY